MRTFHEQCPRIGHGGQARFGNQPGILLSEPRSERLDLFPCGMLVQFKQFQFVDVPFPPGGRQETPRRPQLFHEEETQLPYPLKNRRGEHPVRGVRAQRRRDQV